MTGMCMYWKEDAWHPENVQMEKAEDENICVWWWMTPGVMWIQNVLEMNDRVSQAGCVGWVTSLCGKFLMWSWWYMWVYCCPSGVCVSGCTTSVLCLNKGFTATMSLSLSLLLNVPGYQRSFIKLPQETIWLQQGSRPQAPRQRK